MAFEKRSVLAQLSQVRDPDLRDALRVISHPLGNLQVNIDSLDPKLARVRELLDNAGPLLRETKDVAATLRTLVFNPFVNDPVDGPPTGGTGLDPDDPASGKPSPFPQPPSLPDAGPDPVDPGGPASVSSSGCTSDQIGAGSIRYLHQNISGWSRTSTITSISISSNRICVYHTKAGRWPVTFTGSVPVEGNPWIFANIGGRWYGATWEWLRPGQQCKNQSAYDLGPHIKVSPMNRWVPQPGELVGFAMATVSRVPGAPNGRERSSICTIRWPNYRR